MVEAEATTPTHGDIRGRIRASAKVFPDNLNNFGAGPCPWHVSDVVAVRG